jgi:hypothetical protein
MNPTEQGLTDTRDIHRDDFVSEVEEWMLTRITVLDRLIVDGDREILRLQELLAATDAVNARAPQIAPSGSVCDTSATPDGGAEPRRPDAIIPSAAESAGKQKRAA